VNAAFAVSKDTGPALMGLVGVETLDVSEDTVVTSAAFASPDDLECLSPHPPATNAAMTHGIMVSFRMRSSS
jgi:hypothetical protein